MVPKYFKIESDQELKWSNPEFGVMNNFRANFGK